MLRAVFDTNLFVSSVLIPEGLPAQALDAWRDHQFLLLTSPAIMAETASTLSYDRIRRKYQITQEDIADLLALLAAEAEIVPGEAKVAGSVPEDPDDEIVLACALDGQADMIVSGDKHLLSLGQFGSIPILTVRQFLGVLAQTELKSD